MVEEPVRDEPAAVVGGEGFGIRLSAGDGGGPVEVAVGEGVVADVGRLIAPVAASSLFPNGEPDGSALRATNSHSVASEASSLEAR